jgi:amino-acid N-acetyltransferase
MKTRSAETKDAPHIVAVIAANLADPSLFRRSLKDIRRHSGDFVVASDDAGTIVGCAALHRYKGGIGEVLSVAVVPARQGTGVGRLLVGECLARARADGLKWVWLATLKPAYFARFGFAPLSRWQLPLGILVGKLGAVVQQPLRRWGPALAGRPTFMAVTPGESTCSGGGRPAPHDAVYQAAEMAVRDRAALRVPPTTFDLPS